MKENTGLLFLLGIIAGVVGYQAYTSSGTVAAVAVVIIAAWLLFVFRTKNGFMNAFGTLLFPPQSFFTFFLLGFGYAAIDGFNLWGSTKLGLLSALGGTALSMLIHKYWNMHP